MERPRILTLTTDFGLHGSYIAAMKGVVLGLVPNVQIVDVMHTISPQNILEGAFVLNDIVESFPTGTVHVAVIDPGVGTDRRLVAVSAAGQWFVLPDNGLITGVAHRRELSGVWEITNPRIARANISATFHGRDIMAPAAAHLLNGGDPAELGPQRTKVIQLRNLEPISDEYGLTGEVIFRDAFGNLITNIAAQHMAGRPLDEWSVELAGTRVEQILRTYGEAAPGSLVALFGSSGWLEVAVVNGDAARHLSAGAGATVWVRKKGPTG